jgi:hypothetical protein
MMLELELELELEAALTWSEQKQTIALDLIAS